MSENKNEFQKVHMIEIDGNEEEKAAFYKETFGKRDEEAMAEVEGMCPGYFSREKRYETIHECLMKPEGDLLDKLNLSQFVVNGSIMVAALVDDIAAETKGAPLDDDELLRLKRLVIEIMREFPAGGLDSIESARCLGKVIDKLHGIRPGFGSVEAYYRMGDYLAYDFTETMDMYRPLVATFFDKDKFDEAEWNYIDGMFASSFMLALFYNLAKEDPAVDADGTVENFDGRKNLSSKQLGFSSAIEAWLVNVIILTHKLAKDFFAAKGNSPREAAQELMAKMRKHTTIEEHACEMIVWCFNEALECEVGAVLEFERDPNQIPTIEYKSFVEESGDPELFFLMHFLDSLHIRHAISEELVREALAINEEDPEKLEKISGMDIADLRSFLYDNEEEHFFTFDDYVLRGEFYGRTFLGTMRGLSMMANLVGDIGGDDE